LRLEFYRRERKEYKVNLKIKESVVAGFNLVCIILQGLGLTVRKTGYYF
jgi:hypothetical protein